jgi:hypothetical protein
MHITIDTCVLVDASSRKAANKGTSVVVLDRMKENGTHVLCLDMKRRIDAEYERKLKPQSLGRAWYLFMQQGGRIKRFDTNRLSGTIRDRLGLHEEDQVFIETARETKDRRIVSSHKHLVARNAAKLIKRLVRVSVDRPADACNYL